MRIAAVAGSFYPSDPNTIRQMLGDYFARAQNAKGAQKIDCFAAVSPHAGYIYSGPTAAVTSWTYKQIAKATSVVFIGPNHTGIGTPASVSMQDWQTPLGVVKCDKGLAKKIISNSTICMEDETAHTFEHSIEVQLPFLQLLNPSASIVCVCMGNPDYATAKDLGLALHKSISDTGKVAVIASSDFTHFEKAEVAKKRDSEAIKLIESLYSEQFCKMCEMNQWTICGHGPIAAVLEYAHLKGATGAKMLAYTNSGEATGDYGSVVAYCSIAVPKSNNTKGKK